MQAKADMETPIDTSPVGVIVFDTRSGKVVSCNGESNRIAGELDLQGRLVTELLDVVTVRRADGRRIQLQEYLALVNVLRETRKVSAEETILEFPDGRKIMTRINATPIVSDQGEILSVVVTMQDMAPIEAQERQRAEFLSMVKHELRTPLSVIKGCATNALRPSSVMHPAESRQFFRVIDAQADLMGALISNLTDAALFETGTRFTISDPVVEEVEHGRSAHSSRQPSLPVRSSGQRPVILVVDDDPQSLEYTRGVLEKAGCHPVVTGEPDEVRHLVEAYKPELVLLDLLLPGTDGIELMQHMSALSERPVIFLSAYGRDETIAKALKAGAEDYVVKPFSPTELIARIRAILHKAAKPPEPFVLGELVIDYEGRRVVFRGRPLRLTATEYELLCFLSTNAGKAVTYDRILRNVWQWNSTCDARVVRTIVKKLRNKIRDDIRNPRYIFTEFRVGYRMAKPDSAPKPEDAL